MFDLCDKICLITGASSGIGTATAKAFCEAHAFVFVTDIKEEAAKELAKEIRSEGGRAEGFKLDVTNEDECQMAAKRIAADKMRLDVLFNNAADSASGNVLDTEGSDLDRLYSVNVRGMFNVTKAFLPMMIEQESGNIINMASIGGVVAVRDRLAYCTTKFAVVGLTKAIALDHAKQGIRANAICPGRVETPYVQSLIQKYPDPEKVQQAMESTHPVGRMALPEEVGAAAVYLASQESAFVTGTTFLLDGGWSAGK